ncbi:putative sodium-coupled neutral amino acid transporter 11 isoform X2 [Trachemys scripta elegans]|uniref:putative sodium-coupled neutral amino acid transporter 11 isoform X2 n=1 Tax=Trachemys scripta elegans TaxID=31138 RepID=UPI001557D95B|nr:putative sodium-coupled neutral amino acid transporter 11 isoform X2 [Trachemys scripta elegans]
MEQHARQERQLPSSAHQIETDDRTALVCKPRTKGGNSDLPSAGFNVINSIIGSGIIGLPYSMKEAGFPLGVLLLVGVAYITDYSIILLIKGGNLSGTNSYQELVNKSYGFIGYLILSILQFLYPFIAMISYNIITGDTLTKVFQTIPGVGPDNLLTYRQVIILCITIIFTLPMSLYRDIAKLAKVSFISLILTTVILIIVMIRTATLSPLVPKTENAWIFAKSNAIQAIGVMSFGDIFENYCRDDDLATFGRFCYGVTIILTFPIECFVTREVIANVFFSGTLTTILHVAVTVIVVAVATSISLVYDCLGIVLELNGILSATPLVFIIPTACYLKLSEERWNHSDNLISGLILTVGVLLMTVGFVMTILHPQECSHGKEMVYCFPNNASLYNSTLPPF